LYKKSVRSFAMKTTSFHQERWWCRKLCIRWIAVRWHYCTQILVKEMISGCFQAFWFCSPSSYLASS
jgi:hypothetical protein